MNPSRSLQEMRIITAAMQPARERSSPEAVPRGNSLMALWSFSVCLTTLFEERFVYTVRSSSSRLSSDRFSVSQLRAIGQSTEEAFGDQTDLCRTAESRTPPPVVMAKTAGPRRGWTEFADFRWRPIGIPSREWGVVYSAIHSIRSGTPS